MALPRINPLKTKSWEELKNHFNDISSQSISSFFNSNSNRFKDFSIKFGDLLLDTFIYSGHTTTIESLWAGLPVITLEGNSFASRVSSSILKSIGFDNLVAKTKEEYIEKVVFYLQNKNQLNKFKKTLLKLKSQNALFNTNEFVRNFEKVLQGIKYDLKE